MHEYSSALVGALYVKQNDADCRWRSVFMECIVILRKYILWVVFSWYLPPRDHNQEHVVDATTDPPGLLSHPDGDWAVASAAAGA